MKHSFTVMLLLLFCSVFSVGAPAQDMMRHVDLSTPDMVQAEMSRDQIAAAAARVSPDKPLDLSGRMLNGLDLSGLDLSGVNFRAARLNKTNLSGATLVKAIFDQAWMLKANLSGANLTGAQLFQSQMIGANLDGANLSGARITANLTKASCGNPLA